MSTVHQSGSADAPRFARKRGLLGRLYVSLPLSLLCGYLAACVAIRIVMIFFPSPSWLLTESLGYGTITLAVLAWHAARVPGWAKSLQARSRFSIRTLLIATTLIAILMATLGLHWHRGRIDKQVASKLNGRAVFEHGRAAEFTLDTHAGSGRRLDKDVRELARLDRLKRLDLRYAWMGDEGLKHVGSLTQLEELRLGHSFRLEEDADLAAIFLGDSFLGADLRTLAGRKMIETRLADHQLIIRNTEITDEGMKHLAALKNLRTLVLQNTAITSEGLRSLQSLDKLSELDLRMTYIKNDGLRWLTKLPLKRLELGNNRFITGGAIDHVRQMKQMTHLTFSTSLTAEDLKKLGEMKSLRFLDLSQCRVPKKAGQQLREALPDCQVLLPIR